MKIYLGLVHYPVRNKRGEIVTTSVTNLDIHDISRSCKTFNVEKYFIITPLETQHQLIRRILGHWEQDQGLLYNPDRSEALSVAKLSLSIESAVAEIAAIEGISPKIAITGAQFGEGDGDVDRLKMQWEIDKLPIFLLFGTGWGLAESVLDCSHFKLKSIIGAGKYNHLSVRSAVAIYLDKLMGK